MFQFTFQIQCALHKTAFLRIDVAWWCWWSWVLSKSFKRHAKQFQNSVHLHSFHDRQNFCLQRAHLDVRFNESKKRWNHILLNVYQQDELWEKKNGWKNHFRFFSWKKLRGWEKKTITQRLKWKNLVMSAFANHEILLKKRYPLRENPCKSVDFVLHQGVQPIFYISLQILFLTSIFALLSTDCHFNLIKLVKKVQN